MQPTILLIEDNEINRDMLSRRLERKGYRVMIAVDGADGVAQAQAAATSLILMDMDLPVLDGWEATRRLKADKATAGIPIVALTGHALAGILEGAKRAGCDSFVTKPCLPEDLVKEIRKVLGDSPAQMKKTRRSGKHEKTND